MYVHVHILKFTCVCVCMHEFACMRKKQRKCSSPCLYNQCSMHTCQLLCVFVWSIHIHKRMPKVVRVCSLHAQEWSIYKHVNSTHIHSTKSRAANSSHPVHVGQCGLLDEEGR